MAKFIVKIQKEGNTNPNVAVTTIYEQHFDEVDIEELVVFLNGGEKKKNPSHAIIEGK